MLLCSTGAVEAQEPWTRLSEPVGGPVLRIREGGGWLQAKGDKLARHREGRRTDLAVLHERPTGTIRDMVDDPFGGTFIAADNGLFLTHPSVDNVDRLDLRDGAPSGPLVGIVLDRQRRLWIATTTSFGVVDTRSFFGRTQSAADGLPPGPYSSLSTHPGGGLVLRTPSGDWRYRPDLGEPPQIESVSIDGAAWSGDRLERSWPFTLEVSARATALGGATLRYVEDRRHHWLALPEPGLEVSFDPGRRSIGLVALDRDLRRSEQIRIPVDVSYPTWLRPRYLVTAFVVFAIAVLGALSAAAARSGGGRPRYARAAISSGIIVWAMLQLVAALFPHVRGWPFCGFSMYTWSTAENAVSGPVNLMGIDEEGREFRVRMHRYGLAESSRWRLISPFLTGDEAFKRRILHRYNSRPGNRAAAILVVHERQRLTREGKIAVAPLVMDSIEAPG